MSMFQDNDPSKFSKLYIALKFRLHGLGYFDAMAVLELCRKIHGGFRKNGITPSFQHQLEIAHFILTLRDISNVEDAIIAALCHDSTEDYPGQFLKEFRAATDESVSERAKEVAISTSLRLDKHRYSGYEEYFDRLSKCAICSIVKGVDRINNFQSMERGNFKVAKQQTYSDEVVTYFLPMLKEARKRFPKQMDSYYMIEYVLKSQHELISYRLNLETTNDNVVAS